MKSMYVSVVATRRKTMTVRRSVHIVPMLHNGPQQTIEKFASQLANDITGDWSLNVMQITTHEYLNFRRQFNLENAVNVGI